MASKCVGPKLVGRCRYLYDSFQCQIGIFRYPCTYVCWVWYSGTCTTVGVEAQRVIRIILACLSQNSWQSADTVTFCAQASTFYSILAKSTLPVANVFMESITKGYQNEAYREIYAYHNSYSQHLLILRRPPRCAIALFNIVQHSPSIMH